jgi:hypothetical protein
LARQMLRRLSRPLGGLGVGERGSGTSQGPAPTLPREQVAQHLEQANFQ